MVYVTSDLHGYSLDKFKDFLDQVGFNDDDVLYILGDVIDRGIDGILILQWIMRQPNVKLILGNHESMMLACDFLFDENMEDAISKLTGTKRNTYLIWVSNSGQVTLDALSGIRDKEIQYILEYLREVPLYETLTINGRDFLLVHSGLGNFSKEKSLSSYKLNDLLWTRLGLNTQYYDDVMVVLGYTHTIVYGSEHTGRIFRTDSWIDVDVGVGLGQAPALLRLDDMKAFYYNNYKIIV